MFLCHFYSATASRSLYLKIQSILFSLLKGLQVQILSKKAIKKATYNKIIITILVEYSKNYQNNGSKCLVIIMLAFLWNKLTN